MCFMILKLNPYPNLKHFPKYGNKYLKSLKYFFCFFYHRFVNILKNTVKSGIFKVFVVVEYFSNRFKSVFNGFQTVNPVS